MAKCQNQKKMMLRWVLVQIPGRSLERLGVTINAEAEWRKRGEGGLSMGFTCTWVISHIDIKVQESM